MVHGILQFTSSIAFRYVLHRCESRDIRCRESFEVRIARRPPLRFGRFGAALSCFLFPWRVPRLGVRFPAGCLVRTGVAREDSPLGSPPRAVPVYEFAGRAARAGFDNDPSAGSPTETLLRLLLPLNDKVQWTSRDVAGGEPPASPRSEHFTGPFNR